MSRFATQCWAVFTKDLILDLRARGRMAAVFFFGAMTLLLFSFAAQPGAQTLSREAPGYLWLAILLSSVLALGESFRLEVEDEALEGMLLLPVDPRALFYGKALATTAFLLLLAALLLPLSIALYGIEVRGSWPYLLAFLTAGIAGLAAPGTLYASMTARSRGQDVLLPLLLFPLCIPILVAAVKGTGYALGGDPMEQAKSWLTLVGSFDLVYWSVCGLLFGRVIEE